MVTWSPGQVGEDSPEYRAFLQQPSSNMDDSGFFSVQVGAGRRRAASEVGVPTHSYQSAPFLKGMPLFKGFLTKSHKFAPFLPLFFILNPFFLSNLSESTQKPFGCALTTSPKP